MANRQFYIHSTKREAELEVSFQCGVFCVLLINYRGRPPSSGFITYYCVSETGMANGEWASGCVEREWVYGRRRQTWLSREDRLCAHCPQNEVETELHFLTSCQMDDHIRETYFPQITQIHKDLKNKS